MRAAELRRLQVLLAVHALVVGRDRQAERAPAGGEEGGLDAGLLRNVARRVARLGTELAGDRGEHELVLGHDPAQFLQLHALLVQLVEQAAARSARGVVLEPFTESFGVPVHFRRKLPGYTGTANSRQLPRRDARQLARAVGNGRSVGQALRHLDAHGSEPDSVVLAEALARFLVARCESHHAGWRVVRQVVVDSAADAPWEKCARRAIPLVAADLLSLSAAEGRTPLHRAQHVAARRRAEQIAGHVDHAVLLTDLGLEPEPVSDERWQEALSTAVGARSREQVSRAVARSLRD